MSRLTGVCCFQPCTNSTQQLVHKCPICKRFIHILCCLDNNIPLIEGDDEYRCKSCYDRLSAAKPARLDSAKPASRASANTSLCPGPMDRFTVIKKKSDSNIPASMSDDDSSSFFSSTELEINAIEQPSDEGIAVTPKAKNMNLFNQTTEKSLRCKKPIANGKEKQLNNLKSKKIESNELSTPTIRDISISKMIRKETYTQDNELSEDDSVIMVGRQPKLHHIEQIMPIKRSLHKADTPPVTKKGSPSKNFHQRMHQLNSFKLQSLKTNLPFKQLLHSTSEHPSTSYCLCVFCQKAVCYEKLDMLKQHLRTKEHQKKAELFMKKENETSRILEYLGHSPKSMKHDNLRTVDDPKVNDIKLCKAFLLDNVSFNILKTRRVGGLALFLHNQGVRTVEKVVRGCIADVLHMELDTMKAEIQKAYLINVIFDATPSRGEAFGVVLRWIDAQFNIHHRCIFLRFYDDTFDGAATGKSFIFPFQELSICNTSSSNSPP